MRFQIQTLITIFFMISCASPESAPNSIPDSQLILSDNNLYEVPQKYIKIKNQPDPPPYPAMAKIAQITGDIILLVKINSNGVPISARAISGPPQLKSTAENYIMQWLFHPAIIKGKAEPVVFKFTMTFRLR
ncbi:MAG: energy transducer TonB [Acidobacteria bacterium]|nr:energy transducer TonB [Acidobacteriota bacterium]